jgi:hypothetical protein
MAKNKNKTIETEINVNSYLATIKSVDQQKDCIEIVNLIEKKIKIKPKMWGEHIIGFGAYHYKYESGREGDAPLFALAARANSIVFYLGSNFKDKDVLLSKFGKYKAGKGCYHIKKLADIDVSVLLQMVVNAIQKLHC